MFLISKHKVFISYYHNDDQKYKDILLSLNFKHYLFEDYYFHEDEIDDPNKNDEQIRNFIRDEYIKNASVLILLCGKNTKFRKHIDWEIHSAMFNTDANPQIGILVINLPESENNIHGHTHEEKELLYPDLLDHKSFLYMDPYIKNYPDMPDRITDNLNENVPISVVNWEQITENPLILKQLIDIASNRKQDLKYYNSREMIKQNG